MKKKDPTKDPIYQRFYVALKKETEVNWHRQKNKLAMETGTSSSTITDIFKKQTKASFNMRNAFANACGYEYLEFLEYGRKLLEDKTEPGTKRESLSDPPIGNVIRVYNNVMKKSGLELDAQGEKRLFDVIKDRLKENSTGTTAKDILNIISLSEKKKQA